MELFFLITSIGLRLRRSTGTHHGLSSTSERLVDVAIRQEKGSPSGWESDDLADSMAIPNDTENHLAIMTVGLDFVFKPCLGVPL